MEEVTLGDELDELDDFDETFEMEDTDDEYEFAPRFSKREELNSWTSLILGIVGSLGWIVPIIGLPVTIVGTVLGAVGIKSKHSKGIAIAGFVVNTVFLVASIAKGIIDIIKYLKKSN